MKPSYSFVAMPLMFELPEYEFKLLAVLINFANIYQSNKFFKSAKDLMDIMNIKDKHTLRRLLNNLRDKGLVEIERNFNKPNTFTIKFEDFPNQIEKEKNPNTDASTGVVIEPPISENDGVIESPQGVVIEPPISENDGVIESPQGMVMEPPQGMVMEPPINIDNMNLDIINLDNTIMNTTTMNEYSTTDKVKMIKKEYLNQFNYYVEQNSTMSREEFEEYRGGWFLNMLNDLNEYLTDEEVDNIVRKVDVYTENLYSQKCLSA